MKQVMNIFFVAVILSALVAGCSSPGTTTQTGGNGAASGAPTEPPSEPFVPFSGLTTIELLTASSGAGEKPLFEWSPVDGAAQYSLFLQFTDGQPYWSWLGNSTSVYLGGSAEPPPADAAGPILLDGMSWAVIALDAEGNVIASSNLQSISP